jgi:methionine-rich copper-binding protein CopC
MAYVPVRRIAFVGTTVALALALLPGGVAAHSDLVTADPAQGVIVPSPFTGPIVLTFSEHLANGSKAGLVAANGTTLATAIVDPNAKTMTFTLTTPLAPGTWQVQWVSIADDGDVLRQPIITFTVAPAASSSADASASASAAAILSPGAELPSASPSAGPSPSASGDGSTTGSGGGDVILPIIIALIIVGASAAYLLPRRPRPVDPT